jgi:hypothetical protein
VEDLVDTARDLFGKGSFKAGPEVLLSLAVQEEGEASCGGGFSQYVTEGGEVALEAGEVFDLAMEGGIVAMPGGEMVAAACEKDCVGGDLEWWIRIKSRIKIRIRIKITEDDVQRAGADASVHDGDEPAPVLEVDDVLEPGVKAIGARLNLIANAQQCHPG